MLALNASELRRGGVREMTGVVAAASSNSKALHLQAAL